MDENVELRNKYSEIERRDVERRLMESNKNVSIKDATDDQLERILYRLEMEERTQNLIKRLQRNNMSELEKMNADIQISTEVPIKDLYHYGILGMKWGKRKATGPSLKEQVKARKKEAKEELKGDLKKFKQTRVKVKGRAAKKAYRKERNEELKEISKKYDEKVMRDMTDKQKKKYMKARTYTKKQQLSDLKTFSILGQARIATRVQKGDTVGMARLKTAGEIAGIYAAVGAGILVKSYFKSQTFNAHKSAGKSFVESKYMKTTGKNIIRNSGVIELNPKNYKRYDTYEMQKLLRG